MYDYGFVIGFCFDVSFRTDDYTAAAGFVCFAYAGISVNCTTCRKVGSLDVLHQLLNCYFRIFKNGNRSIDGFGKVVRRHICSHTYGDTGRSIHKQVRKTGGKNDRLPTRIVVVRLKVDCIGINIAEHFLSHLGQTYLSVTHGCGRVAVDRAEVALPVNQGVP